MSLRRSHKKKKERRQLVGSMVPPMRGAYGLVDTSAEFDGNDLGAIFANPAVKGSGGPADLLSTKAFTDNHGRSPISLKLGDYNLLFDDGEWRADEIVRGAPGTPATSSTRQELTQLRQENSVMKKQNNLLQFKVDALLDMLAETQLDNERLKSIRMDEA